MSYTPTIWIDGETPINAENLNKLEQAVKENRLEIDGLGNRFVSKTLLWENASPTSEFPAQTVNVDFSSFTHYAIEFRIYATAPLFECGAIISIANSCRLAAHGSNVRMHRDFDPNTHAFTDAKESYVDGLFANNNGCIPYKIYGIKGVIE